jgi:uncharacterized protein (TIGR03067 family)
MTGLYLVALATTLGAPAPKEAPKKAEPPAIVGEWECIEMIVGGRKLTAPELAMLEARYEFTSEGKYRGRFGPETGEGKYALNPAKDPAEIDLTSDKTGSMKGGLYRLDKDTLILCYAEGKGGRPEAVESPAGSRIFLMTFKRAEKKRE